MKRQTLLFTSALIAVMATTGCLAPGAESDQPKPVSAVIREDTSVVRAELQSQLGSALGRAQITLGPEDFTETSHISVLPPGLGSHEDRSAAMPVVFDFILEGGKCYAVRRDTDEAVHLKGIECQPATN